MNGKPSRLSGVVVWLSLLLLRTGDVYAQRPGQIPGAGRFQTLVTATPACAEITTVDHYVPHISTVPANAGEPVQLFVREQFQCTPYHKPAVVMVEGSTTSAVPVFDLDYGHYSWMAFLAEAGFDVFAVDLTGYGLSPRPMMDNACNASLEQQLLYLIPNPLDATCPPSYPFLLTTPDSDMDELGTVVDFIREQRALDRVHFAGWSRGGARAGSYAAHYPDKVDRLVLMAPNYGRTAPDGPPPKLPLSGVPLDVQGKADFFNLWDADVQCTDQFDPLIREPIATAMLASDPIGSTWGSEGVRRAPGLHGRATNFWGWNSNFAGAVRAPTLILHGLLDHVVGDVQTDTLNEDLGAQHLYLKVACASHFLVWENRHTLLLRASEEWLRDGTFAGYSSGVLVVDESGNIQPTP